MLITSTGYDETTVYSLQIGSPTSSKQIYYLNLSWPNFRRTWQAYCHRKRATCHAEEFGPLHIWREQCFIIYLEIGMHITVGMRTNQLTVSFLKGDIKQIEIRPNCPGHDSRPSLCLPPLPKCRALMCIQGTIGGVTASRKNNTIPKAIKMWYARIEAPMGT